LAISLAKVLESGATMVFVVPRIWAMSHRNKVSKHKNVSKTTPTTVQCYDLVNAKLDKSLLRDIRIESVDLISVYELGFDRLMENKPFAKLYQRHSSSRYSA
jgi:hypothetical protein